MKIAIGAYTALIGVFLAVQLAGFVWAHVAYRDDVEDPKLRIFDHERERT